MVQQQQHGMAASIRAALEPETFDLAGQSAATIESTIQGAFSEPLVLQSEMIRLTFVVGAGKQARQKYDAGAAKAVTSTLIQLGYVEDRGASMVLECAGTFKMQHDTAKNTKTVVVFPKVVVAEKTSAGDGQGNNKDSSMDSILTKGSPIQRLATAPLQTFSKHMDTQCPSWSQKRALLTELENLQSKMDELDQKLVRGSLLTPEEQEFYEEIAQAPEKQKLVKEATHKMVEEGRLTKHELDTLRQQNALKIQGLQEQGKPIEKAVERKEFLAGLSPKQPRPLKFATDIAKLQDELVPLLELEQSIGGRLLTVKETQAMGRKDEILAEIASLEQASRGWFEDDDAFAERLAVVTTALERRLAVRKNRKSQKSSGSGGANSRGGFTTTSSKGPVTKWVTPNQSKGAGTKKKKSGNKGGQSVFSKVTLDSDSEDDEQDGIEGLPPKSTIVSKPEETTTPIPEPTQPAEKTSPKKRKKKKKTPASQSGEQQQVEASSARSAGDSVVETEMKTHSFLGGIVSVLTVYVVPLVLQVLNLLLGLVVGLFGKKSAKQKKK